MSARTTITVNDRANTPVAHSFTPRANGTTDVALFVEAQSMSIGERKITISTKKANGKTRARILIENPTLVTEVVNGVNVPKVPRTCFADLTFTFPDGCSLQERKDTVGFMANLLLATQAMVNSAIVDLEGIW